MNKALTSPKEKRPSLRQAMADSQRAPNTGWSQGRGQRKDHGARLAATGTPNRRFSGASNGDDNANLSGQSSGSDPGSQAGSVPSSR